MPFIVFPRDILDFQLIKSKQCKNILIETKLKCYITLYLQQAFYFQRSFTTFRTNLLASTLNILIQRKLLKKNTKTT